MPIRILVLRLIWLTLLCSWLTSSLAAQPSEGSRDGCIEGVWRGKVGTTPVTMEFRESLIAGDGGKLVGHSYYRESLDDLLLVRSDGVPGQWKEIDRENRVTGVFTLSCHGRILTGQWHAPTGNKSLSVMTEAAEATSFNSVRFEALRPNVLRRKNHEGPLHEELSVPTYRVTGVQLLGTGDGVAKVNAELMIQFKDFLAHAIECRTLGRQAARPPEDYEQIISMDVIAVNSRYAIVRRNWEGYCGGAHLDFGVDAITFNLATGREEDVATWLVEPYTHGIPLGTDLGHLL
ncbi:MAG: hypothetical protein JO171_12880, partial [Paludibacterium sp.]|uniref:hypothetical protein n=1 Tax=Paludibacterium sp. TaxID=1917523 RepID=UPI0025E275ED